MTQSPAPDNGPAEERPIGRPAGVKAFLPNELDPTVFDEGFLRQLERLGVLMKQPVRGGLKGGRRSVKRGQSVEFADYRDYALGDDLRQLDWNVYARLEKLFVKLFIEEEDVTITFLIDASPSMAFGRPQKLLFAKRAAAALGYIGLASEDRVVVAALGGRTARRQGGLRGSGRVFRLLGAKGLDVVGDYRTAKMPPVNQGLLDGELAWRQHDGGHTDAPNMKYFIEWADKWIGHTPPQ